MANPTVIKVNNLVRTFVDLVFLRTGEPALSGLAKLLFRFGVGRHRVRDLRAALILTQAEEAAVLGVGRSFVLRWGGRFFVAVGFADLVYKFIAGEGVRRTPEERFGIVLAHLSKSGPTITTAIAAGEQLLFGLHDELFPDKNLFEAGLEIIETVLDFIPPPFAGPPLPPDLELLVTEETNITPIIEPDPGTGQEFPDLAGHRIFRSIDP